MKHISQVVRESTDPIVRELLDESICFHCGLPLTSDDFKLRDAGSTGAHLKCYEEFERNQHDEYLDNMISKYGRENI